MRRGGRVGIFVGTAVAIVAVAAIGLALVYVWSRDDDLGGLAKNAQPLSNDAALIVPGVYHLGKSSPGAVYVVDTSDGLILIDAGLEASPAAILEQLRTLKLDVTSLKAILLTHVHADHSLGAKKLREMSGAKVYAGRDDCVPLREGGPRVAFLSTFHMPQVVLHKTTVDVELQGGESIAIGDTTVQAIAAPGHTPGSMCYLIERKGLRALFTGDTVQSLDVATSGALGTYSAALPPSYRGNAQAFQATLARLRELPTPDLILPGHPAMDQERPSPHLPVERWHALLDKGLEAMRKLLARYQADGGDFLDGTPKEILPGLRYLGDLDGFAMFALKVKDDIYLVDAPGGANLPSFVADRFATAGWGAVRPKAVLLTSINAPATDGLADLVRATRCTVYAAPPALEAVRKTLSAAAHVASVEELAKVPGFPFKAMPLVGRGLFPVCYSGVWEGKAVLISGRIPVKLSDPATLDLIRDLSAPGGSREQYRDSIQRLRKLSPDVWLPSIPVHGQNANLYDREWLDTLDRNAEVVAS